MHKGSNNILPMRGNDKNNGIFFEVSRICRTFGGIQIPIIKTKITLWKKR